MFIFEFLVDSNFCLVSFTIFVFSMINYTIKINYFTNCDRYRSNWFETISRYFYKMAKLSAKKNPFGEHLDVSRMCGVMKGRHSKLVLSSDVNGTFLVQKLDNLKLKPKQNNPQSGP